MPVFSPAKWHLLKMPKGICLAGFSSCFCWNKIDIWMKRLRRTCVLLFLNCYPGVSVEKAPPITGMDYYCYCSRTEKFMTFPAILFCHFRCVWPFPQKNPLVWIKQIFFQHRETLRWTIIICNVFQVFPPYSSPGTYTVKNTSHVEIATSLTKWFYFTF